MKHLSIFFGIMLLAIFGTSAQDLPRYLTEEEQAILPFYQFPTARGIATPPPFENLRNMAEWEEVQAITVTWRSYPRILKSIVRAAKEEAKVIIICQNAAQVESYLMATQNAQASWPSLPPLDNMDNIDLVEAPSNSVWIRDYMGNTVYGNRVDTLLMVDWIYNRPRPADDVVPEVVGAHLGVPVYTTTIAPEDLVNTGGNFMSDGQGTGFASKLILSENAPGNPYFVSPKTASDIDEIKWNYQGLSRFIKMEELPYDIISHIDMHMKILDEETLIVGEYPEGVADGPQINANIDFVLNNFLSYFGEPYNIIRIPMPDSPSGLWPDSEPLSSYYRTYTNGVFMNKTFLYPTYREQYDTTAARIYEAALPGYTLVPIDCDDDPDAMIAAAGAIHCITHSVGVSDPLLIVHQRLKDTFDAENNYMVKAEIEHRTGVASATLHWRAQPSSVWNEVPMVALENTEWQGDIPAQPVGTHIEYYISAMANNGKNQVRPIVAPEGFCSFQVIGNVLGTEQHESFILQSPYPNPAANIVSIPVLTKVPMDIEVDIFDLQGRKLLEVYRGEIYGDRRLSANVDLLAQGVYLVSISTPYGKSSTPIMVSH